MTLPGRRSVGLTEADRALPFKPHLIPVRRTWTEIHSHRWGPFRVGRGGRILRPQGSKPRGTLCCRGTAGGHVEERRKGGDGGRGVSDSVSVTEGAGTRARACMHGIRGRRPTRFVLPESCSTVAAVRQAVKARTPHCIGLCMLAQEDMHMRGTTPVCMCRKACLYAAACNAGAENVHLCTRGTWTEVHYPLCTG